MRANREVPAKSLLDCCFHGLFVARMAATGDVDRSERGHQRLLSAVRNSLRQFAHIAVQINAFHPEIKFSEASSSSVSLNRQWAISHPTFSNRTSSRGRSCP